MIDPSVITITRVLENSFVESKELFKLINTKAVEGTKKLHGCIKSSLFRGKWWLL